MRSKINNNKIYIRYHDVTVFLHFISHEDLSRVMVGSVLLDAWQEYCFIWPVNEKNLH